MSKVKEIKAQKKISRNKYFKGNSLKINILGVPMSVLTKNRAIESFVKLALEGGKDKKYFTATPNAEILLESEKNPELKTYLKSCELNFPDSVSVLWAGECVDKNWGKIRAFLELLFLPIRKKYWTSFPEIITGSGSFEAICKLTSEKNIKISLIGGGKNVAQKTAQKLQKKFKNIQIVSAIDGLPFADFDKPKVLEKLKNSQIIFVALGCPRQELWIAKNLEKIASASVAMGIGGTFDFYIGKISRAPKIFQKLGLEWFFRLIKEPSRWKRIFNAVFVFPYVFLKSYKK